jgi:amino acid adenylation domain-containing protein/non-ribosomal peptide synthase protein (TIGR01720 family)
LQYWQQLFSEPPPRLELPLDEKRPHVQCFSGARVFFELEVELTSRLASLAREARTTPFVVLVSAFSLLLSKYSGQDELVIGTPVHGRTRREVEGLIGMFVNTLALRLSPEGTLSFCAYLQRVKDRVLEAFAHESCPFDLVIERLNLPRDAGRSPLFDVTFVLQNEDMGLAHESVRPVEAPGGQSRFDLTLIARPDSGGTRCELEYCTALFNPETAARMARHFVQVCEALVAEPERELRHVSLASAGEIAQILEVFNDTRRPYPDTACIPALFEAQAREHADKVAVKEAYPVAGRTEARSLSYRELDQQATGIARRLQSAGAKPGSIVPVFVDKSADAIAAFLGILKAGCAYLPVDDEVPGQRKRFLLTDSRASHAVVHRPCPPALTHMLDQCGVVPVFSDGDLTPDTGNDPPWKGSGEDRAYVLYTSGSTGIPKGTVVQHKSVVRLVRAQSYADFSPTLRILQTGALDFDASTLEIWGPLLSGGTVCLLAKPDLLEIDRLKRAIQENAINTMWMSSPLFNQLLESDGSLFDSLRHVLVGGDVVSPSHVRRLRARVPRIRVTNGYGPTENTTFSTTFDLPVGEEVPDPIPIGRPIANSICYVLDGQGRVLPVGVPGELWVGGDGVALGYLNRDDLTRAAFIPDPFRSGGRIYRTGDRARWLTDGTLHFLGRLDQQLKLRGFRIEPGEIEKQLLEHGLVREACVVAACGEAGDKALHAYIAASAPTSPDELVTFLRQRLPAHMIPSTVVILDRLPLNKNGKIDRSLLPAPAPSSLLSAAKGLAAETPAERMMGEIVAEVLGLGAVSMDADFFSLGGDSIKAIQLCARARAHGMQLAVRDVFSCPRIRELALLLKAAKAPGRQHPGQGPAPLAPIQAWFFKQGFRDQHHFTQGVRIEGKAGVFDGTRLRRAWEQLIVRHASLRSTYGKEGGAWMPVTADVGDSAARWYTFEEAALATQDSGEVERRVREAQRRLSVENGPMSTLGLYHLGKSDVLVVAIHHLAVDAVSWQILMEDLLILYGQGEDAELAVGSDTFAGWTRSVQALAESNEIGREVEYWHKLASRAQTIPRLATNAEPVPCSQLGTVRLSYSAAQVQEASRAAERACAATTEEILLCALGGALAEWQGTQAALIQVESHGRDALQDALDDGPDVSRTVGWFTSAFPLVLPAGPNPLLSLQAAKEARRTVPHSGLGFGILAGATEKPDARVREAVALLRPDICFNFLGALLPQRDEALGFEVTRLPFELTRSPEQHAPFALDVEAGLDGGGLEVVLRYARPTISAERAAALAGAFDRQFHALIAESRATRTTTRTASDFGAKDLGADDLVDILDELAVTR